MPNTAGLDVQSRPNLLDVLHSLHMSRQPRIIMGLRVQDPIPEWITHLAYVRQGSVITGEKDCVLSVALAQTTISTPIMTPQTSSGTGAVVVDLENVKVQYSNRVVGILALSFVNYILSGTTKHQLANSTRGKMASPRSKRSVCLYSFVSPVCNFVQAREKPHCSR